MRALNTDLIIKADRYIDEHHETFVALGGRFFDEFGSERGRTQVRNLQQLACSATRFADIEDFVKTRSVRETGSGRGWAPRSSINYQYYESAATSSTAIRPTVWPCGCGWRVAGHGR